VRIAIIAWGSVVWDPRNLMFVGKFEPTDLRLPLEFCRVSGDGRLTLVIDEKFGEICPARVAVSGFRELQQTIKDLRARENTTAKNIGFVDCVTGKHSAREKGSSAYVVETVVSWVAANDYDAAVWTALSRNFLEPFSVDAAIKYLEIQRAQTLERALRYIRKAPPEVQTPVRAAVKARWPGGKEA